jgi:hypothetical protein
MDLIIFNDGLYYLYPVTPELVAGEVWKDCFDLCDILREKLTTYKDAINKHVLKDGSFFLGCMCL